MRFVTLTLLISATAAAFSSCPMLILWPASIAAVLGFIESHDDPTDDDLESDL